MENKERINQLHQKLDALLVKHQGFAKEIDQIRVELHRLRFSKSETDLTTPIENKTSLDTNSPPVEKLVPPKVTSLIKDDDYIELVDRKKDLLEDLAFDDNATFKKEEPVETKTDKSFIPESFNIDLEKFIGENLISKIGILILILGVGIGTKYSIENNLISPLTRIILGYLAGLGLLGFGIKLKPNYTNYSAVLVSGAIAILYFITFAAHSFYGLIPQMAAFGLMVVFTIFAVIAALNYDKQVIAHIGLVGAYGVPFLLSNGSGNVTTLFSYMVIINIGILLIAFKKYWKTLYYSATGLTWLIYSSWIIDLTDINENFGMAMIFLCVFFAIFYITFLAYKLTQHGKIELTDTLLILFNAFIFYGFGYFLLSEHETGEQLLGLFTLGNGLIHFLVSAFVYQRKLTDKNLLYLISGLVLVFITAAIPVQLDGNWVTLLWALEAAILFWLGRTKEISIYEKISYPVMFLAFGSLLEDWEQVYYSYKAWDVELIKPIFNIHFASSLLFIAAFSFINFINQKYKEISPFNGSKGIVKMISYAIPSMCLIVMYFAFKNEIALYWDQLYATSEIRPEDADKYTRYSRNFDLLRFKEVWIINFSLFFFSVLSFFNIKKLKSTQLGFINLALNILTIGVFVTIGLFQLSELRESYLGQDQNEFFTSGKINIWIRYVSFAFVGLLLYACREYNRTIFPSKIFKIGYDVLFYGSILWIASSELIHWMDMGGNENSYKLGLSIFWGVYALILIGIGIWKRKKHLRVGAIALFAGTLLKLFFYDLVHLNTISKTIVLVSLGVLLLIISFLYNKYSLKISGEDEN